MPSDKLDAVNAFINAAGTHREFITVTVPSSESALHPSEIMRRDFQMRLELARTAQVVSATPSDEEAEKIVGEMLLERIDNAVRAKTAQEWEVEAQAAIDAVDNIDEVLSPDIRRWMDSSAPLVNLGLDALNRSQDQQHEIMMAGFRQAAENTPGADFRFTEIVGDQMIKDETVLGPTPGDEDTPGRGTDRLSFTKQATLGLDDQMFSVDVERLTVRLATLLLNRHRLSATESSEMVRLTVAKSMALQSQRDLTIADVTGELPIPTAGLGTEHFPALRAQLFMQHYTVLIEGSVFSRVQRGDPSAEAVMRHLVVVADMLAAAEPYFLPRSQIKTPATDAERHDLPASKTFLVWHDEAVPVSDELQVLAWVFATDEQGNLDDVAHIIMLWGNGELEGSWCNLKAGAVAATGRAVAATLSMRNWEKAKKLRLPGELESPVWKKALVRSSGRARRGGLHGLHTLIV